MIRDPRIEAMLDVLSDLYSLYPYDELIPDPVLSIGSACAIFLAIGQLHLVVLPFNFILLMYNKSGSKIMLLFGEKYSMGYVFILTNLSPLTSSRAL